MTLPRRKPPAPKMPNIPKPQVKVPVASFDRPKRMVNRTAPKLARKLTNPKKVANESAVVMVEAR